MALYFGDKHQIYVTPPSSYQTAIQFVKEGSIHENYGRAIVIGSDVYYSPNSSRKPPVPKLQTNIVRNPLKDNVEEYHNPQWWRSDTGYLPFLPTSPQFGSPPFHVLYNNFVETGPRRKRRVRMDSNDILNWTRLEATLGQIFKSFQSTYSIPEMSLMVSTSLSLHEGSFDIERCVYPVPQLMLHFQPWLWQPGNTAWTGLSLMPSLF